MGGILVFLRQKLVVLVVTAVVGLAIWGAVAAASQGNSSPTSAFSRALVDVRPDGPWGRDPLAVENLVASRVFSCANDAAALAPDRPSAASMATYRTKCVSKVMAEQTALTGRLVEALSRSGLELEADSRLTEPTRRYASCIASVDSSVSSPERLEAVVEGLAARSLTLGRDGGIATQSELDKHQAEFASLESTTRTLIARGQACEVDSGLAAARAEVFVDAVDNILAADPELRMLWDNSLQGGS